MVTVGGYLPVIGGCSCSNRCIAKQDVQPANAPPPSQPPSLPLPVCCCATSPQRLCGDLAVLEEKQTTLNEELLQLTAGGAALADIETASLALAALQAEQEAKEERWLELAEIAGDL